MHHGYHWSRVSTAGASAHTGTRLWVRLGRVPRGTFAGELVFFLSYVWTTPFFHGEAHLSHSALAELSPKAAETRYISNWCAGSRDLESLVVVARASRLGALLTGPCISHCQEKWF